MNDKQVDDQSGVMALDREILDEKNITLSHDEMALNVLQASDLDEGGPALRALTRKIDKRLLPIMCITYALQFYDKVLLGHAAVFGLIPDLGLEEGARFSNTSMIFYCGYILGAFPIAYTAQHYPTAKVCGVLVVIWSAIILSTAGCTNYAGILVNRFFLGVIESGVAPAFMLVVSMWYTKPQQVLRSGLWFASSGGANLIVPVISYGVGHITGGSLATWQYMYLLAGSITLLWSVVIFIYFPDDPASAGFITEADKALFFARMKRDNAGDLDRTFKPRHLLECLRSFTFWAMCLMACLLTVTNGPISSFSSIIFNQMGFSPSESLLLNMPTGALALILGGGSALLPRKFANVRLYIIIASCPIALLGCALVWQLPSSNVAGRLVSFYLMNFFCAGYVQVIGNGTSLVGGYTKKATMAAGISVWYCAGSIIGAEIFSTKFKPRFSPGFTGLMVCLAICFVLAVVLRIHLARKNKKRDQVYGKPGTDHGLDDLTDRENKDFRYLL